MITKTFEIRDRGTFIAVLGIKLSPGCEEDRYLIARSGYGRAPEDQSRYVVVMRLDGCEGSYDPFKHDGGPRTMPTAHQFIIDHFDELASGSVVCVEHILGERETPKRSESLEAFA